MTTWTEIADATGATTFWDGYATEWDGNTTFWDLSENIWTEIAEAT